jgi:hypothetical protein
MAFRPTSAGPANGTLSLTNGRQFRQLGHLTRGQQTRFEMVNAQDLAVSGRLDWRPRSGLLVGGSAYYGNSAGNRPKPDLNAPAHVGVFDLHLQLQEGPLTLRGLFLRGTLQNADLVSRANRNLSNNLNVKRTPGSSARAGWSRPAGMPLHVDEPARTR